MATTPLRLSLTFALACLSAALFLMLRCEGRGNPVGRHSRWWSLAVIALTGGLSTAATFVVATIIEELPSGLVSLGVVAPSGLWIGHIREGGHERRSPYVEAATLWLSWLLARLGEGMAEDKNEWIDQRANPEWGTDDLLMAAMSYHKYLHERLSPQDRRQYRIGSLMRNIDARMEVARLIDNSARPAKILVALNASRPTQDARYARSMDDLTRLGNMLRHDSLRDMSRLLSAAYNTGLRRLPAYEPPPSGKPLSDPPGRSRPGGQDPRRDLSCPSDAG